jgi:hypothetical protein
LVGDEVARNKIVGILIAIGFIIFGIISYFHGLEESRWPICTGTIKSVTEVREYRNHHYRTEYRTGYAYLVNGTEFHKYQNLATRHKVDETTTVHFDPNDPEHATLDPQAGEFGGITMAIIGVIIGIVTFFAKPRGPRNVDLID